MTNPNMTNPTAVQPFKILLTGGSGFVGKNIIALIKKDSLPYTLYNLGRTPSVDSSIVNIPCGDITTFNFESLTEEFDYIIHTLALSNEAYCKDFSYANAVNVEFTKKLLAFASTQKNLKKFVHISSIIIYSNTNPTPVSETAPLYLHYSNYAFTKGVAESYVNHYLEKFNLPVIIFRLSNIYGPYQAYENSPFLVPSKIMQGINEKKIEVFSLVPKRDWIYSEDAVSAIIASLKSTHTGIYNLGAGIGSSVEDIISIVAKELAVPYTTLDKPMTGPLDFYCDISKTMEAFSWKPTHTLEEGLKKTISYIQESKK